ncbi:LacI family DNA-binding transcriptional regulator [Hirschia litorea]|uniref:LacI family DNA-binding transcriptional regulator n=1 Tax=Hirschia litorea TaxID=1199156 RepID=A0ABW2IPM6_9PROT
MSRRGVTESIDVSGRRSTIVDVAREAGVSIKTVSRVLNHEARVSEKTQKKVREVISRLHYRPNLAARKLRNSEKTLIALICDNPQQHLSGFNADLQIGAMRECNKQGYFLIVDDFGSPECAFEDILKYPDLAGVVLSPGLCDNLKILDALDSKNIPYVRVCPQKELDRSSGVKIDDYQASVDLVKHLIDLGHESIGYIHGHPDHMVSEIRYSGFKDTLDKVGLRVNPQHLQWGLFDYDSGLKAAQNILNSDVLPTAIMAGNDDMAAAVIAIAGSMRIKVPEELSVVGFDNAPIASLIFPRMTTIDQPAIEMSKLATEMLIKEISSPNTVPHVLTVEHRLILRESAVKPM